MRVALGLHLSMCGAPVQLGLQCSPLHPTHTKHLKPFACAGVLPINDGIPFSIVDSDPAKKQAFSLGPTVRRCRSLQRTHARMRRRSADSRPKTWPLPASRLCCASFSIPCFSSSPPSCAPRTSICIPPRATPRPVRGGPSWRLHMRSIACGVARRQPLPRGCRAINGRPTWAGGVASLARAGASSLPRQALAGATPYLLTRTSRPHPPHRRHPDGQRALPLPAQRAHRRSLPGLRHHRLRHRQASVQPAWRTAMPPPPFTPASLPAARAARQRIVWEHHVSCRHAHRMLLCTQLPSHPALLAHCLAAPRHVLVVDQFTCQVRPCGASHPPQRAVCCQPLPRLPAAYPSGPRRPRARPTATQLYEAWRCVAPTGPTGARALASARLPASGPLKGLSRPSRRANSLLTPPPSPRPQNNATAQLPGPAPQPRA